MQTLTQAARERLDKAVRHTISRLLDFDPANKSPMTIRREMASVMCEWRRAFDYLYGAQIAHAIERHQNKIYIRLVGKHWAVRRSDAAKFAETLWLNDKGIKP